MWDCEICGHLNKDELEIREICEALRDEPSSRRTYSMKSFLCYAKSSVYGNKTPSYADTRKHGSIG